MKNGDIVRYVQVTFAFGEPCWYFDPNDDIEEKDYLLVPYGVQTREGIVIKVVRCVYPYVPFDNAKEILSVLERRGTPKC